jgi:RNA polymerase sigma-70 factor (ECF subfamily)
VRAHEDDGFEPSEPTRSDAPRVAGDTRAEHESEALPDAVPSGRRSVMVPRRAHDPAGPFGELSDGRLVALGLERDARALETLYRRHAPFAIQLATRIAGSVRDVEDVVHDAFMRAFERLRDLEDPAAFRPWLGAIVVHAVRSRLRRARLMRVLGLAREGEPPDIEAVASPEASPVVRAEIAQVYALLRTLATDDRIAWTLRAVEGHDLATVARLARCSLATAKRRIARAQRFLDEHFVSPALEEAPS